MARILVIDDDAGMVHMLETALRAAGHQVRSARDGQHGLQQFTAQPSELVIADIFMPEQDGLEVIRAVRRQDARVKILAITGLPDFNNPLGAALRLGANRTLEKPFRPDELLAAVNDVLLSKG